MANFFQNLLNDYIKKPAGTFYTGMDKLAANIFGGPTIAEMQRDLYGTETFEEERKTYEEDPLKALGKATATAADLASFALPVGKGATMVGKGTIPFFSKAGAKAVGSEALKRGAVGAIGGYGVSDDDDEALSTVLGGLGGAASAPLAIGASSAFSKIGKTAAKPGSPKEFLSRQRGEAIGLDPNKLTKSRVANVSSSTQGRQVIDDFFTNMDELGLSTRTSNVASDSADTALNTYRQQFNSILSDADATKAFTASDSEKLIKQINSQFKNNPKVTNSSVYQELIGDIIDLGDNYTPTALNAIREKARDSINWTRSGKQPNAERAASATFETLDDFFKAEVPAASTVLSKMKNIYTVLPTIQGKATMGGKIPLGTVSTNVQIPTAGANEFIQSGIGKMASATPDLSGIGKVATGTMRTIPSGMTASISGGQMAEPSMDEFSGDDYIQQLEQKYFGAPKQSAGGDTDSLNQLLAVGVLTGEISANEVAVLQELLGLNQEETTTVKQTEGQRDYQLAADALSGALDMLNTQGGAGKLATFGGDIASFFGSATPSSAYRAQLDTATAFLRKALIGSGQSEAELKNLNLPKPTDEPEIAVQKIEALLPLLYSRAGGTERTDVDALSDMLGL